MAKGGPNRQRVLFLCTHNSARSQLAEALLRHRAGDRFQVESAGTEPAGIRPEAVAVMHELGIAMKGHFSKGLASLLDSGVTYDYVITVCDAAAEACPAFPNAVHQMHWSFPDPSAAAGDTETRMRAFRAVRDALDRRIRAWLDEATPTRPALPPTR